MAGSKKKHCSSLFTEVVAEKMSEDTVPPPSKRPHDDLAAGSGAGRGGTRAPGAPPNALAETLKAIQTQLTLQTAQIGKLADKEDLKGLTNRVSVLSGDVKSNTEDIEEIRRLREEDKSAVDARIEELERRVQRLADGGGSAPFDKLQFQRDKYQLCRRSLRVWPVPVMLGEDDDLGERHTKIRAAVCVFFRDLLKVENPEDLDIEDLSFPRVVPRSKIRNEVLVRFATVSERDEVISHAANLKDCQQEAGVRLEIPDHLQADFKVLIQYGNEARKFYGVDVRRSVRFFEEDFGLILHLGLPSGQWLRVTPSEAREMGKFRRSRADSAMRKTLSSTQSLDDSLLLEAAAKAFVHLSLIHI